VVEMGIKRRVIHPSLEVKKEGGLMAFQESRLENMNIV
jgi:hypothetical protein